MEFILGGNPGVGAAVKCLRFQAPSEIAVNLPLDFISLLSKFTKLGTLQCGREDETRLAWHVLRRSRKRRWESIFQLPSVHTLHLFGFSDIPVYVLFPCTNLQSLHLNEYTVFKAPKYTDNLEHGSHLPLTKLVSVQTALDFQALDPLFTVHPSIGAPLIDKKNVKYLFINRIHDDDCWKLRDFSSLHSLEVNLCESLY